MVSPIRSFAGGIATTPSEPSVNRRSWPEIVSLYAFVRPYRARFFGGLLALLCGALLGLCFPYWAGALIDAAVNPLHRSPGFSAGWSISKILFFLVATVLLQGGFATVYTLCFSWVGQQTAADVRQTVYRQLLRLPMVFFGQRRVGELSSRISSDVAQVESLLTDVVPQMCRQVVMLVGGIVLITLTSFKLTLATLCIVPALVGLAVLFGRKIRKLAARTQDQIAETATVVQETIQAIASVKAYANERFEERRYGRATATVLRTALHTARWRAAFIGFMPLVLLGSTGLVMGFGARLLQAGEITTGEFTRFVLYTTFMGGAMSQAAELFTRLQRALGATQRVRELLAERPESTGTAAVDELSISSFQSRARGEVRFERVYFHYASRPEISVLNGVSLTAKRGEKIALVGPSGAGKSTLTALLFRFYDPTSGKILLDGKDLREHPLSWLRTQMAIVPQDILLFGGSIEENIRYGKPEASSEEVRDAAYRANAHDFISRFPEGYGTVVGDRGVKLSGGQRQRIAIARAILRNPPILILDEATSSLDSESEKLVQTALETLMQGRTTLMIAHRLATIRAADRIVVLDAGLVSEEGTHDELVSRADGLYRKLSVLQFDRSGFTA